MANEVKLDPTTLLGKSEINAVSEALQHGIQTRIISRDGVSQPLTEDYAPNRWDLEVERGVVVGVRRPTK
jgi:hypothetical protein